MSGQLSWCQSASKRAPLPAELRGRLDYDAASRSAILGEARESDAPRVCIVAAGTSDLPVAREAARALAFHGRAATLIADVGVAGLWRLMQRIEEIRGHDVVVAVAGMEGALFPVLAGLVAAPVIAVPTSVGYGAAGGRSSPRRWLPAHRGWSASISTTDTAPPAPPSASSPPSTVAPPNPRSRHERERLIGKR